MDDRSQELNSPKVPKETKDPESSAIPSSLDSVSEPNPTEGSEDAVPSNPSKRPMSPDDLEDSKPSTRQLSSEYMAGEEEGEGEEAGGGGGGGGEEEEEEEEEEEQEEAIELDSSRAPRVILAVCGTVEAVHFDSLYDSLAKFADVKTVATESAYVFIDKAAGFDRIPIYTDRHDLAQWKREGDSVLHLSLVEWADAMVIAPLSIAMGLCGNLVTNIVLAWDYSKPLYLVPAMDKNMWNNVITRHHVKTMHKFGASFITPYGTCVCKEKFGDGSMVDPSDVGDFVNISILEDKRNCGCPWVQ